MSRSICAYPSQSARIASITAKLHRLRRCYDPSDALPAPRSCHDVGVAPGIDGSYPQHLSNVRFPMPRWTETGASGGFVPVS